MDTRAIPDSSPLFQKISRRSFPDLTYSVIRSEQLGALFQCAHKSNHPITGNLNSIKGSLPDGNFKKSIQLLGLNVPYNLVRQTLKQPESYENEIKNIIKIIPILKKFPDLFVTPFLQVEKSIKTGKEKIVFYSIEMTPLNKVLASNSLSFLQKLSIAEVLTKAVVTLHQEGIVHRDLKPENVLLGRNGNPYIFDFDFAEMGASTVITGSPLYMPYSLRFPSTETTSLELLKKGDLFALGVTFMVLFFGENSDLYTELIAVQESKESSDWEKKRASLITKIRSKKCFIDRVIAGLMAPFDQQYSLSKVASILSEIRGFEKTFLQG